jgi:anti-sigma-K factor RskA
VPDPLNALRALWRSLAFWRVAGMASAAAALILGVGLAYVASERARTPILVAVLVTEGSTEPAAVVNAFADGRTELVPLRAIAVPPDRALEIWTLWDRSVGPRSIGLLDQTRSVRLNLQNMPKPGPNQLFEITLEPKTGSPTGRPTGPVLMKGLASTAL